MIFLTAVTSFLYASVAIAAETPNPTQQRAEHLSRYLLKERSAYHTRERKKSSILSELDSLNEKQNGIREKIATLSTEEEELDLMLSNLAWEVERHRNRERQERAAMRRMFLWVYKLRRDGLWVGLLEKGSLRSVANRLRLLYRTLRFRSVLLKKIVNRAQRLEASERELRDSRISYQELLEKSRQHQMELSQLLQKKRRLLSRIEKKQKTFTRAEKEYKHIAKSINDLFGTLKSKKPNAPSLLRFGTLAVPVEAGHIKSRFGKFVHPEFRTITFNHGIEIGAPLMSPVRAVLDGTVEYEGWVKGVGNVVIINHDRGFYSLSGHLYKTTVKKGEAVQKETTIGLVGDTGRKATPSLYFEIREKGKAVNPLNYYTIDSLRPLS